MSEDSRKARRHLDPHQPPRARRPGRTPRHPDGRAGRPPRPSTNASTTLSDSCRIPLPDRGARGNVNRCVASRFDVVPMANHRPQGLFPSLSDGRRSRMKIIRKAFGSPLCWVLVLGLALAWSWSISAIVPTTAAPGSLGGGCGSVSLGRQQAGDRQGREGTVQGRRDVERRLRGEADRRGLDPAQELDHAAGGRTGHRAGHAGQERGRARRVRPREDRQGHRGRRGREHADRAGPEARRGGAADPGEEPARRDGRRRAGQDLRRRGPQELRRDRPAHGRADGPLHGQGILGVAGVLARGAAAAREDVPLQGPDRGDRGDHPPPAAVPDRDVRALPQGGGAGARPDIEGLACRGRTSRSARTSSSRRSSWSGPAPCCR